MVHLRWFWNLFKPDLIVFHPLSKFIYEDIFALIIISAKKTGIKLGLEEQSWGAFTLVIGTFLIISWLHEFLLSLRVELELIHLAWRHVGVLELIQPRLKKFRQP